MPYVLPRTDERTIIVGSTGSGKTFLGCWLLSTRDFHLRPAFIIDFKGDQLIHDIGATEIDVYSNPPTQPGLYVVRPIKNRDDDGLEVFLWKIWSNENTIIYFDEGYMLGQRNAAVSALLTQGRSKLIEIITLVQRPVFVDKFFFSEANHFYVMKLQLEGDRKFISEYLDGAPIQRLPRFHSLWYNANEQDALYLRPVPSRKEILSVFERRLSEANISNGRKVYAI